VVPISFAGWGVREGAAILTFGLVGVSPEDALSISVMLGVVLALHGIPGGILWLFNKHAAVRHTKSTTVTTEHHADE
jgi:hypothetical protein